MRAIVTFVALVSALVASPVAAQVTAPTYQSATGNTLNAQGVMVLNSDGTNGSLPQRATSTTTNGSVATANTFQSALAANATRKGCAIYNNSANAELIFLGAPGSATAANAIPLPAGGAFNCGSFQGIVLTDQISITSATVASTFVVVSQ
ncbi:hypothetical protein [Sphingomonas sp. UBA978]|uniref:hypothetical protein n=1 Tax=Sphingomonas sp. UBA978 TaxID=1947536 RepID=UPI0025F495ED|nr:hypothetical protein [Sphingomonas sp. UBA978]